MTTTRYRITQDPTGNWRVYINDVQARKRAVPFTRALGWLNAHVWPLDASPDASREVVYVTPRDVCYRVTTPN